MTIISFVFFFFAVGLTGRIRNAVDNSNLFDKIEVPYLPRLINSSEYCYDNITMRFDVSGSDSDRMNRRLLKDSFRYLDYRMICSKLRLENPSTDINIGITYGM